MAGRAVTGLPDRPTAPGDDASALRRLRLDLDDLRFENDRLKASIAEKQDEIVVLSERLGVLQGRLDRLHRITAWSTHLRRFSPFRLLLRGRPQGPH